MNPLQISAAESSRTGANTPAAAKPETSGGAVILGEFTVEAARPIHSGKPAAEYMVEVEKRPGMPERLARARRIVGNLIDPERATLRALRMAAGLSQAKLAERAGNGTTQSYIARVETGTLDPSTDLIVRLASALGVEPARLFSAIRRQREEANGSAR